MDLKSLISDTAEKIKNSNLNVEKLEFNPNGTSNEIRNVFQTQSGISLNEEMTELYSSFSDIDLQWSFKSDKSYYGAFTMIPLLKSLELHKNIIQNYYDAVEYAEHCHDPEAVLKEIENYYPLFTFNNGNAFCIDKRNCSIILYDHSVFEFYDSNSNGKLIATDFTSLIKKWSKVLFMEQFWWYSDCMGSDGINLSGQMFTNFLNEVKL